jgi:hypothetical protein
MSKYRYQPIFTQNMNDDTLGVVERFAMMLVRLDIGYMVPELPEVKHKTFLRSDMRAFIERLGLDPTRGV